MSTAKCEQGWYLPQELFEAIIDAVGLYRFKVDANATFKSLSLLCRALVPRCRRHLFREVKFDRSAAWGSGFTYPRHNSSRVQAFLFLLTERGSEVLGASIGEYVQLLRIENNMSPLFYQITARLPNLKHLHVVSSLRACDDMLFFEYEVLHEVTGGKVEECNAETRTALLASGSAQPIVERLRDARRLNLKPLRLERLYIKQRTHVELEYFHMVNFIEKCLHVQDTSYTNLDVDNPRLDRPVVDRGVTVRRLDFYSICRPTMLGSMLGTEHGRQIFRHLEYLNILVHTSHTISPILSKFKSSLLGLELNLSLYYDDVAASHCLRGLDLSAFSKIKHLRLVNWPRSETQPLLSLPNGVMTLLSVYTTAPSVLETFTLGVQRAKTPFRASPLDALADDGNWEKLRRVVVPERRRSEGFRCLSSFKVQFFAADFVDKKSRVSHLTNAEERAKELLTLGDGIQTSIAFF